VERKLQFFVAGLGRFGESVAVTLENMGYEVMAMDIDEDVVQHLSGTLSYAVCGDASDENDLAAIGAGNADVAVVAIGELSASLMATLILKDMGVKKIVVKALDPLHGKMLKKIGADKIIYSEKEMGVRVAHNLINPGIVDYIEMDNNITVVSIQTPESWIGRGLIDLDVRRKYNITVVAIRRNNETIVNPGPDIRMEKGDMIVILGDTESVKKATDILE
jgi:trk system potassium uptake protein TrkA